jgi:hypothetical protein
MTNSHAMTDESLNLPELPEADHSAPVCDAFGCATSWEAGYTAAQLRDYALAAIALNRRTPQPDKAGVGDFNEEGAISVAEDGTLHIDLQRGGPSRQFSLLALRSGEVKFAIYCEGRQYHGDTNDPKFIEALADYAAPTPPAAAQEDGRDAVYGYCPICGAKGAARERRPNGDDICANKHKYPSRSAIKKAAMLTSPDSGKEG